MRQPRDPAVLVFCVILFWASMGFFGLSVTLLLTLSNQTCKLTPPPACQTPEAP